MVLLRLLFSFVLIVVSDSRPQFYDGPPLAFPYSRPQYHHGNFQKFLQTANHQYPKYPFQDRPFPSLEYEDRDTIYLPQEEGVSNLRDKKLVVAVRSPEPLERKNKVKKDHDEVNVTVMSRNTTETRKRHESRHIVGTGDIAMSDSSFVFPDHANFDPNVGARAPACAQGSTYCKDFPSYPEAALEGILRNSVHQLRDFFGNDTLNVVVDSRIDGTEETPLCQSKEEVIFPKLGRTMDEKWLYIINQQEYRQGIRVEQCVNNDHSCDLIGDSIPLGYTSSCKQKYIFRKLVAVNPNNGEAYPDNFRMPSCCTCYFTANGEKRNRRQNRNRTRSP